MNDLIEIVKNLNGFGFVIKGTEEGMDYDPLGEMVIYRSFRYSSAKRELVQSDLKDIAPEDSRYYLVIRSDHVKHFYSWRIGFFKDGD